MTPVLNKLRLPILVAFFFTCGCTQDKTDWTPDTRKAPQHLCVTELKMGGSLGVVCTK